MVAHGYGLAAYGSPHLIFSNVLWGCLVRAIPTINGVLGYSLAAIAVLLVVGWMLLYFLLRLGTGYLIGLLSVALILLGPTLFPQFTINAGLLTVVAVVGWRVHARFGDMPSLIVACVLAWLGYLIRSQEFFLVLGVALPLLPWRTIREQRRVQIAFLLMGMAIALAALCDRWSYSGAEWQYFSALNAARAPFTDFGAGEYLKQRPEILARYGYSQNDIDLIRHWFFVDPQIANPKVLSAMLGSLGAISLQTHNYYLGLVAIKALLTPLLLPVLLAAIFLFVINPRRSLLFAWIGCLAALFAIGMTGRPGALRVYVPLLSFLLVAPLLIRQAKNNAWQTIAASVLLLACAGQLYVFVPAAISSKQTVQQVQKDLHDLPSVSIVSWGSGFPFEFAFPLLSNDLALRQIKLYPLGVFTHAPFSTAVSEQRAGLGMLERLRTDQGVPVIGSSQRIDMLSIYCRERWNGQMRKSVAYQSPSLLVQQVQCKVDE